MPLRYGWSRIGISSWCASNEYEETGLDWFKFYFYLYMNIPYIDLYIHFCGYILFSLDSFSANTNPRIGLFSLFHPFRWALSSHLTLFQWCKAFHQAFFLPSATMIIGRATVLQCCCFLFVIFGLKLHLYVFDEVRFWNILASKVSNSGWLFLFESHSNQIHPRW